jgi:hypothetical protein
MLPLSMGKLNDHIEPLQIWPELFISRLAIPQTNGALLQKQPLTSTN